MKKNDTELFELRFLEEIRHHFKGWQEKVLTDFNADNFDKELNLLKSDEVYSQMGFASEQYVAIRLMGRMSISIGRRLGEIYDKIPRFAAKARFNLEHTDVAPKYQNLELDVQIPYNKVSSEDQKHIVKILKKYKVNLSENGIGIEIRYNFNPNDSSRLRKDCTMANNLNSEKLTPVYIIFSTISPRNDAITRLKRAGWQFIIGDEAYEFMNDLVDMDVRNILNKPKVKEEVKKEVDMLMASIYNSYALGEAQKKYLDEKAEIL